ncbi:hypothetical protein [Salinibacterium sp. ZJ450]|uniref:hypothetical protein n=1 Tax=Salinibacterium sp. ZJ450 TaxID=2708338 RepID=UPI0014217338|nr:hypothetical protein [Salinibacterium sp. ZJ450]
MSAKDQPLILGGVPRADLLPPEVRNLQRGKKAVRLALAGVVVVAIVVAGGVGFGVVRSVSSQIELQSERDRTDDLLAQQLNFAEARSVANQVDEAVLARRLATTTEIDWRAFLDEVAATLPLGVSLTEIVVDSTAPSEVEPAAEAVPLQEDWVATVTINATSLTVPNVELWLNDLEGLTGFAGVAPPVTVEGTPEDGYQVKIEVHVNEQVYTGRFEEEAAG